MSRTISGEVESARVAVSDDRPRVRGWSDRGGILDIFTLGHFYRQSPGVHKLVCTGRSESWEMNGIDERDIEDATIVELGGVKAAVQDR